MIYNQLLSLQNANKTLTKVKSENNKILNDEGNTKSKQNPKSSFSQNILNTYFIRITMSRIEDFETFRTKDGKQK